MIWLFQYRSLKLSMGLYTLWSEKVHPIVLYELNFFFSEVILICRWKTLSDTQNWTFKSLVSSSRCDWEPDRLLGLESEVLTPPSPLSCRPEASRAPPFPVRLPLPAPSLEVSFSSVSQPLPQHPRDLPVPRPLVSSLLDLKTSSQRTAHTLMFYFLSLDRKEG